MSCLGSDFSIVKLAGRDMEDDEEQDHPTRNLVLSVCDLKQHGDVPNARCGAQTVTMATNSAAVELQSKTLVSVRGSPKRSFCLFCQELNLCELYRNV